MMAVARVLAGLCGETAPTMAGAGGEEDAGGEDGHGCGEEEEERGEWVSSWLAVVVAEWEALVRFSVWLRVGCVCG